MMDWILYVGILGMIYIALLGSKTTYKYPWYYEVFGTLIISIPFVLVWTWVFLKYILKQG